MRIGCDMNVLQSTDLLNRLISDPSIEVVLADSTIAELCKHDDWKTTIRMAMGQLQPYLDRTSLAVPISDGLQNELGELKLFTTSDLIDADQSKAFRRLTLGLFSTTDSDIVDGIEKTFPDFRGELLDEELNQASARNRMKAIVQPYRNLAPKLQKALNGKSPDPQLLECYAQMTAEVLTIDLLVSAQRNETVIYDFVGKKPLLMRYLYLLIYYAVSLSLRGSGWDMRSPQKDLNDFLDIDHVLTGSYCDDFLSKDTTAAAAYESLKRMLQRSSGDATEYVSLKFGSLGISRDKP